MKTQTWKTSLSRLLLSAFVLGIFFLLGVGSIDELDLTDESVALEVGLIISTILEHEAEEFKMEVICENTFVRHYEGRKDGFGNWNGRLHISTMRYNEETGEFWQMEEIVEMVHGH